MDKFPKRGDIYWVSLDPTLGSEIRKTRPALVISNDIGNELSSRVVVAPITSSVHKIYPFQVKVELEGKICKILLDQIRTVDKARLKNKMLSLPSQLMQQVGTAIQVSLGL